MSSILPKYQSLADNLAALHRQTVQFCTDHKKDELNNLQKTWRSASSLHHIQENIAAIESLYLMPYGFSWYFAQQTSQPELDLQIKQHFSEIKAMLAGIQTTAVELIENGKVVNLNLSIKNSMRFIP